jgi:hypothetical protein
MTIIWGKHSEAMKLGVEELEIVAYDCWEPYGRLNVEIG